MIDNNNQTLNFYKIRIKQINSVKIDTLLIDSVSQFGFDTESKYIRKKIKLELSAYSLGNADNDGKLHWEDRTVFLQYKIEGYYPLLSYIHNSDEKFFYLKGDSAIQLVYKRYFNKQNNLLSNELYKQQLLTEYQNIGLNEQRFKGLTYTEKSLSKFFTEINHLSGHEVAIEQKKPAYKSYELGISLGVIRYDIKLINELSEQYYTFDFKPAFSPLICFNIYYKPSFFNHHFKIGLEPYFYKLDVYTETGYQPTYLKYSGITFPIAFLYNYKINKFNLYFGANINFGFCLDFENSFNSTEKGKLYTQHRNFSFKGGISFYRFGLEYAFFTNKSLLSGVYWNTTNFQHALILRYTIF